MPRIPAPILLAAAAAASTLAACTTPASPVEVTRFHRAEAVPQPRGTISVAPLPNSSLDPDSIEARTYYDAVAAELARLGYSVNDASATYRAEVNAQRGTATDFARRGSGVSVGAGGATGGFGSGVGLGVGLDLGSLFGGGGGERVITELEARIVRTSDDFVIWEGRAMQETGVATDASQLNVISAKLASALFQGFPGNSGETIGVK